MTIDSRDGTADRGGRTLFLLHTLRRLGRQALAGRSHCAIAMCGVSQPGGADGKTFLPPVYKADIDGTGEDSGQDISGVWRRRLTVFDAKREEYGPVRPLAGATLDELFVYQLRRYDWVNLVRSTTEVRARLEEFEEFVRRRWTRGSTSRDECARRSAIVSVGSGSPLWGDVLLDPGSQNRAWATGG